MARLIDRSFDPNRPVKVRRFFVAAGRHWEPGRVFPWKKMAIAQRRVKLLFDAGKLMHPDYEDGGVVGPDDFTPALMGEKPSEQTIAQQPTTEQDVQGEDTQHVQVDSGAVASGDAGPAPERPTPEEVGDDLDTLTMPELREIADREGAPTRVSRAAQREAIREHRLASQTE